MNDFQISSNSEVISNIETDNFCQLVSESRELIHNLYLQINQQPIQFTAYGFYTINLALLASVRFYYDSVE